MAPDSSMNTTAQGYASYSSGSLDYLYPELAGYEGYDASQTQPTKDSISQNSGSSSGLLLNSGLSDTNNGGDEASPLLQYGSSMPAEYMLIESLSGDVAASFGQSFSSTYEHQSPEANKDLPNLSSFFDYDGEDYSGQLF